jgi:hypothetical protein
MPRTGSKVLLRADRKEVLGNVRGVHHRPESGSVATVERVSKGFGFLSVEPTRSSVRLTWTALGNETRYMLFSQEIYGVYFTKRKTFKFVGLEPGTTYNVFCVSRRTGTPIYRIRGVSDPGITGDQERHRQPDTE